jgi:hypothetical protein
MECKEEKITRRLNSRFGWIIFFFRLAGIPFDMKKISAIYATYMRTAIFCTMTVLIGIFLDIFIRWDDFGHAMTNIRVLMFVTNIVCVYFCCRYVRTLAMMFVVSQVFVYKQIKF